MCAFAMRQLPGAEWAEWTAIGPAASAVGATAPMRSIATLSGHQGRRRIGRHACWKGARHCGAAGRRDERGQQRAVLGEAGPLEREHAVDAAQLISGSSAMCWSVGVSRLSE